MILQVISAYEKKLNSSFTPYLIILAYLTCHSEYKSQSYTLEKENIVSFEKELQLFDFNDSNVIQDPHAVLDPVTLHSFKQHLQVYIYL